MFSIKWVGLDNLKDSLNRLERMSETVIKPSRREWLQGLRHTLKGKPYPPKRDGQTYIRTGNLANRWAVTADTITNSAGYSEYVVGDEQAPPHLGRWWTAREVVEEETGELADIMIKGIGEQWH